MPKTLLKYIHAILCCCIMSSAAAQHVSVREKIPLAGNWKFQLDSLGAGIKNNWQDSSFREEIKLPGTMEENRKGNFVEQPTASHLNQTWKYIGAAWYQKEIEIPESWG